MPINKKKLNELIEIVKKKDPELASKIYFYLEEEPELKGDLKKAYEELKKISPEFAKIFGRGLFFNYLFIYENENLTVEEFFKKLIDKYLDEEAELKEIKTLIQEQTIPLINASAQSLVGSRLKGLYDIISSLEMKVVNSIKYLSQLMRELAIWERINFMYENLIKYSQKEAEKLFEGKKEEANRYKYLAETAMVELKDFWLNKYDKINSLFQIQQYNFTGIVNDFKRFWEDGLVLQLLSDNVEERAIAKEIIMELVRVGILRKYAVVTDIEGKKEELLKKYKTLSEVYEKIKNLIGEKNISEVKKKIKELEEKFNIEKLEKELSKKYPDIRYTARVSIVAQKLNSFYDWLYTNYKIVRSAYLSYRALIRLNLYSLINSVKILKWALRAYKILQLKNELNPHGLEFLNKAYLKFDLLASKDLKNNLKLVVFLDIYITASKIIQKQELNNITFSGEYKMNWYFSILTKEEYEKLKIIELSAELEEIELISKEFIENFIREIRAFVERGFYFSLSTFTHRVKYLDSDLKELLEKIIKEDPEAAEKLEKIFEEEKKEEKKEKSIFETLKEFFEKLVAYIVIALIDPMKIKNKKKKKKENKTPEEIRKEMLKKLPKDIEEFMKDKFFKKLKEIFNIRKEFITDKLFKV